MTLLILEGKCPGFDAIGLVADEVPPKILPSVSSDASATLPRPTPQRLKKWRRVSNCNRRSSWSIPVTPLSKNHPGSAVLAKLPSRLPAAADLWEDFSRALKAADFRACLPG